MAAASRTVRTSGRLASVLVEEPARCNGAVGEEGGAGDGRSPRSGVDGHCCSWAGGAVAGRGRSAPRSAGGGPYLDLAPRGGVFSLVGGVIVRRLPSEANGTAAGRHGVRLQV